jgi:hypothetical protein
MKFVKRMGILAACLPICSEGFQKRFYVYTKKHEDGTDVSRDDFTAVTEQQQKQ